MSDDAFRFAPPHTSVAGLNAAPIDIQRVEGRMVFDGSTQGCSVEASMVFTVAPPGGHPVFDLRQVIATAALDGAPLSPSQIAHHDLGGGVGAEMRVLAVSLPSGTPHTLALTYDLGPPIGTASAPMQWASGPRLVFRFAFDDLNPARYLEKWLPANLLYDQFEIQLEVEIVATSIAHTCITNGSLTTEGPNHFSIAFPSSASAFSPLLELRPTDTLETVTGQATLPVSPPVTIQAFKPTSVATDLANQVSQLETHLSDNESFAGPYAHGGRFVLMLSGGGMEYDGGTTTGPGALRHEAFHSWWGRGVKPAGQPHGWWDEAWTVYHDEGALGSVPFDDSDPPVELCSRNPWQRVTPTSAYSSGRDVFAGVAALIGVGNLRALMRDFYLLHANQPTTTEELEAYLVARSGEPRIVDAFHRWVYGFSDPAPPTDLWMKDAPAHLGEDAWGGVFWDSPDLWIRRDDDDGTDHQEPASGRDNWFYARVRNAATAGTARHFMVTFAVKSFAGTEFVYPVDFLPSITAAAGFELGPRETTVVKARWPAAEVPPTGAHACLLAAVLARSEHPVDGTHVWEHANLAQKNLTVAEVSGNTWLAVPFVLANFDPRRSARFILQLWPRELSSSVSAELLVPELREWGEGERAKPDGDLLECGAPASARLPKDAHERWTSAGGGAAMARRFKGARAVAIESGPTGLRTYLRAGETRLLALRVHILKGVCPGDLIRLHLVKRAACGLRVLGGLAIEARVADEGSLDSDQ